MKLKLKDLFTITTVALLALTPTYGAAHDDEGVSQHNKRFSTFEIRYAASMTNTTVPPFQSKIVQKFTCIFTNPTADSPADLEGVPNVDLRDCSILLHIQLDGVYYNILSTAKTGYDPNHKPKKSWWDTLRSAAGIEDAAPSFVTNTVVYVNETCAWKETRAKGRICLMLGISLPLNADGHEFLDDHFVKINAAVFNMKNKEDLGRVSYAGGYNQLRNSLTEIPMDVFPENHGVEIDVLHTAMQEQVHVLSIDPSYYPGLHYAMKDKQQ